MTAVTTAAFDAPSGRLTPDPASAGGELTMEQLHYMSDWRPRTRGSAGALAALFIAVAVSFLLTGCVTSGRYRLAKSGGPPAKVLDLSIAAAPLELDLTTVIVFKGPGSWKKEARWDEYVVALVNHGGQPIVVEAAELIDVQDQPRAAGDDPWKLEKLSRTNWARYRKAGLTLAAGAGAAALYAGAVVGLSGGTWLAGGAALTSLVTALAVIPVAALADVSVVAVMNHRNKRAVQAEFQRRRLVLPHAIAPGESATGSLFFPMTPGPQRLIVHGHADAQTVQVGLDLGAIASLHLKVVN